MDLKSFLRKDGRLNNRLVSDGTNPTVLILKTKYKKEIDVYGMSGVINILLYNNGDFNCKDCRNPLDKFRYDMKFKCKKCLYIDKQKVEKQTLQEKYGVTNVFQLQDVKEKIKNTNFEKYGVYHPTQSDIIKDKIKKNNNCKYGKDVYRGSDAYYVKLMGIDKFSVFSDTESLYNLYLNECETNISVLSKLFNMSDTAMINYFRKNNLDVLYYYNTSKQEIDLYESLKSFYAGDILRNVRNVISPKELDIYIPKYNLAIELCGAYWHNEKFRTNKISHYEKWKMCYDNGIQLLTFWDIEYENKKPQIISFIKSKMGIFDTRVYARNLIFKELDAKQYIFFEENHIQGGKCNIGRNFGLLDKSGNILGCASYAQHHRDSTKYTLNRLAFKSGVQVVGGVGKLLKNSLGLIDRDVVTWSDNRYSTGEIYEKNGFSFDANLPVDYCYFDNKTNKIMSKQSNKKSNINCPKDMTEKEYCLSIGRYRLWDCGKKRWVYLKHH